MFVEGETRVMLFAQVDVINRGDAEGLKSALKTQLNENIRVCLGSEDMN